MKRYIIIGSISIAVVCSILAINYMKKISNYKEKVNNIVIKDVNLDNKEDGKYIGEFDADVISAKVEVEIKTCPAVVSAVKEPILPVSGK